MRRVYDKPPNLTTSAVVEKIEKTTRYNKAFGSASTTYFLYLTDSSPELKYLRIGRKIDEDDLARSIGQRVTIMCYRADVQSDCHATNYQFQGAGVDPTKRVSVMLRSASEAGKNWRLGSDLARPLEIRR